MLHSARHGWYVIEHGGNGDVIDSVVGCSLAAANIRRCRGRDRSHAASVIGVASAASIISFELVPAIVKPALATRCRQRDAAVASPFVVAPSAADARDVYFAPIPVQGVEPAWNSYDAHGDTLSIAADATCRVFFELSTNRIRRPKTPAQARQHERITARRRQSARVDYALHQHGA